MAFTLDIALAGQQSVERAIEQIGGKLKKAGEEATSLSFAAEKAVKVIGTDYAKAAATAGAATGTLNAGLEAESKLLQKTWQETQRYNNLLKDQQKLQQQVHRSSKDYRDSLRDQIAQMRHAGTATATLLESKLKLLQREQQLRAESRLYDTALAKRVRAEEAALKSAKALEESARKRSQRTKELEADLRHLGTTEGKRAVALEQQVKGERELIAAEQKRSQELKKLESDLKYLNTTDGKRQELMKSELALQRQLIQQGAKQNAELRSSENALKRYNSEKQRSIELARLELAEKKKADKAWAEEQLGLKRTTTAVNDHSSSIKRLREEIKFLQSAQGKEYLELKREEAQLKKTRDAMLDFERRVNRAGRETSEFARRLKLAEQASASFRASLAGVGTHFGMFTSSTILAASAAYAFSSAVRETITAGSEFEHQMDRVVAVMDATGAQSEYLTGFVRDLAKETVFTAREVSDGLMYLGMAGLDAGEAVEALEPSLRLASIGMLDMGTTADIVTNIMVGMGLEASQIGEIVDDMATAITSSNMDVRQLGNAMSYVAPLAREADISLQEITASLEVLHNTGIKASRAGTAMRTSMLALLAPTAEAMEVLQKYGIQVDDNSGRMRNWTQLLTEMAEAQMTLADIEAIVGKRQAAGMKAMIDSAKATEEWKNRAKELGLELKTTASELAVLTAELERNAGSAEVMKRIMEDNLRGDWLKLLAAVEEKYLQFYEMNKDELRALVQNATDFVQGLDPTAINNGFRTTIELLGTGLQVLLAWRATSLSIAAISAAIGVAQVGGAALGELGNRRRSGGGFNPREIASEVFGPGGKLKNVGKLLGGALKIGGAVTTGAVIYDQLDDGRDWLSENFNPWEGIDNREQLQTKVYGRQYEGLSEVELARNEAQLTQVQADVESQLSAARQALEAARSDQYSQAALDEAKRLEAQIKSMEGRLDEIVITKKAISDIRADSGFFASESEASAAIAKLSSERKAIEDEMARLQQSKEAALREIETKLKSGEIDATTARVERGYVQIDSAEELTKLQAQRESYDAQIQDAQNRQILLSEQQAEIEKRLLSNKEEIGHKSAGNAALYWEEVEASNQKLTTEQKLAKAKAELHEIESKYLGAHISQADLRLMAETNIKDLTDEQLVRRKQLLETHKDEFKGLSNTTEQIKRAEKLRESIAGYEEEIARGRKKAADEQARDNALTLRANEQAFQRMISTKQEAEALRDQYANIEYRNRAYENGILLLDDENYERERAIRLQEEEIQLSIRHLEIELKKKKIGPEGIAALKQEIEYQKDKLEYLKRQKVQLSEGVKFGLKQKEAIESMYSTIESETIGLLERGFKDSQSFFDSIVGSFKRMLAELAYQAAIKPIIVNMVASVGGMMGMGTAANAWAADQGVTVGGGMGNLVDMGKSAWSFWKGGGQADVSWFNDFATSGMGQSLGLSSASMASSFFAGGGQVVGSSVAPAAGSFANIAGQQMGQQSLVNGGQSALMSSASTPVMSQGASLFSQGLSYSPWGALGAIGGSLLGVQGAENPWVNTAFTTGGSILGSMAGVAMASAAASAAGGAAAGAQAGTVAGPIGAVIGAVLGMALGGALFGGDKSYRMRGSVGTSSDFQGDKWLVPNAKDGEELYRETAFGFTHLNINKYGDVNDFSEVLDAVEALDGMLAGSFTRTQMADAKAAVDGFKRGGGRGDQANMDQFMRERYSRMIVAADSELAKFVQRNTKYATDLAKAFAILSASSNEGQLPATLGGYVTLKKDTDVDFADSVSRNTLQAGIYRSTGDFFEESLPQLSNIRSAPGLAGAMQTFLGKILPEILGTEVNYLGQASGVGQSIQEIAEGALAQKPTAPTVPSHYLNYGDDNLAYLNEGLFSKRLAEKLNSEFSASLKTMDLSSALVDLFPNFDNLEGRQREFAEMFMDAVAVDLRYALEDYNYDFTGELPERINQIIADALKSIDDKDGLTAQIMGEFIGRDIYDAFAQGNETQLETVGRVIGAFELLSGALNNLGIEIEGVGIQALAVTEKMVEVAGGLDILAQNMETYYQSFYSEEERAANTMRDLTAGLTMLRETIPPTRMAFRELVEELHRAGDIEGFNTLIENNQSYAAYYAQMEQWTASLFETYRNTIGRDPSAIELYRWLDKLKTGEALFSDVVKSLVTGLSEATEHLTQQDIEAFQSGAQDIYDAYQFTLEVAQEEHALALERISQEENLLKSLRTLIDNLKLSDISPLTPAERLAEAQRQYASILTAVEGGDFSRAGELDSAAKAYLGEASSYYASSGAYENIFNNVLGSLESLEAQYGTSLSYEERKEQLDNKLLATQDRAKSLLEDQLKALAESYELDKSILSVLSLLPSELANAIAQVLPESIGGEGADYSDPSKFSLEGLSLDGIDSRIIDLYNNLLGRAPDAEGAYHWQGRLDQGLSMQQMTSYFLQEIDRLGLLNGPGSANGISVPQVDQAAYDRYKNFANGSHFGGIESVPFDGYKAILHRGERVVPASRAKDDEKSALIAEIRALRAEVTQLREDQNRNAQRAEETTVVASNMSAQMISQSTKDAIESKSVADRAKVTMR